MAGELLALTGATVDMAEDGQQAMDALARNVYDMVLMDLQMPVMDGLEATRAIRARGMAALPVVAMTASVLSEDKSRCLAAGMNDFVAKPIEVEELFSVLRRWLLPVTPEPQAQAPVSANQDAVAGPPAWASRLEWRPALERMGGDWNLYALIMSKFRQVHAQGMGEIRAALEAGAVEDARRLVHTLKGVGGNIGAMGVHRGALAVEQALAEKGGLALDGALGDLERAMEQVLADSAMMDAESPKASSPDPVVLLGPEQVDALMVELRRRVEDFDTAAMDTFHALLPVRDIPHGALWHKLEQQLGNYDFAAAARTLDKLMALSNNKKAKKPDDGDQ